MKIAIQISGLIYSPHDFFYTLQKCILDSFDCDIFIASSSGVDQVELLHPTKYSIVTLEDYETSGTNRIIQQYADRYYRYKDGFKYHSNCESIFKSLYQKYVSNQIRMVQPTQYDVVLWLRGDLTLAEPFTPLIIQHIVKKILIPYNDDYHGGINDQVCIGDPDLMTVLCNEFLYIDEYFKDPSVTMHPERLLLHHILMQKIPMRRFFYRYYLKGRTQCAFH